MTGIVERLQERINDAPMPTEHLLDEAADTIEGLLALVFQYRDDLKRPPTGDSLERRLAAIDAEIAKAKAS